ncbi:Rib/alpha-like domain-containing protein [Enterococcus faecalis]|uniref:Rib/alpha-like domain-containing protein n=1 Tax=Enterococcus faecalis TaxID=1351 RepID=UPI002F90AE73
MTPGNYEGVIEVTYPDGTKDTVKVPVEVTDNRSDADKYEPTVEGEKVEIGGKVDLTDNVTNLPTLPQGTTKEAFDLHVLGTPPAFVLSQDQTLIIKVRTILRLLSSIVC